LFACFSKYYVEGLHTCWRALREISKAPFELYYPSTVWVKEFNPRMPEYAASKSAGENLCRFLELTDPHLTVKVPRLPRLPTDQTLGLGPHDLDDPLEALFRTL
jgi:hypothetical protein